MAAQQEVIKKFMASLNDKNALNDAIKSSTIFSSADDAISKMIRDCKNAKSGDEFLKKYCGINLDNDDTGAITGFDAGSSTYEKDASAVVPEVGSLENFTGNEFTANGLTIRLAKFPLYDTTGELTISDDISFNDLSSSEKYIWQALKTWWGKGVLNLIAESYGDDYSFNPNSTSKILYFGFIEQGGDDGYQTALTAYPAGSNYLRMAVNSRAYGALKNGGNPDGDSYNVSIYLDRTIAHEMTHAVMMANVDDYFSLPQFVKEGIAELTIGVDDKRKNFLQDLAADSASLKSALSLTDTGTDYIPSYAAGYMFFRYIAKQTAEHFIENTTSNKLVTGTALNDTIYSKAENVSIKAGAGNDSIYSYGNRAVVYGENGNDTLTGEYAYSKLYGGAGNDLISITDYSFNSIDGGKGNDTIIAGGRKHSVNGGSGNDKITLTGNELTIDGGSDNDTILSSGETVSIFGGNGNDSLRNAGGKNVTMSGGSGNDSLFNNISTSIVESGARVSISGGGGKDFVYNSGSEVTISGGTGNDLISLSSYAQNNLIRYNSGDGSDKIYGFNATSTLSIGGGKYSTSKSGANLVVTVDDGKISLMGAANLSTVNINGVYKDPTFKTVTNSTKSPVTIGSAVKIVDASSRTKSVKITGNKLANTLQGGSKNDSLYGGAGNDYLVGNAGNDKIYGQAGNDKIYGGSGNDSLKGGTGNDSLWGSAGSDTFIYAKGDGKDIIFGFEDDDLLKITGTFSATYSKSNGEVYFKVGSTSKAVTLKNFTATSFHVNGKSYHISGTKLVK